MATVILYLEASQLLLSAIIILLAINYVADIKKYKANPKNDLYLFFIITLLCILHIVQIILGTDKLIPRITFVIILAIFALFFILKYFFIIKNKNP